MKKKIISIFTMMFLCGIFNLSAQSVRIGSQAPDFSIELQKDGKPSGKTVTLADYKGKALLLHFWATWCPPCKVELPHLEKLVQKIQSKGDNAKINFLAVCISDSQNSLTSFMKKKWIHFCRWIRCHRKNCNEIWNTRCSYINFDFSRWKSFKDSCWNDE